MEDFKGYIHDVGGPTANFRHPSCEKQLENIRLSLIHISDLLYKSVNMKYVKSSRIQIFKGWARKAKEQSQICEKLEKELNELLKSKIILNNFKNYIIGLKENINYGKIAEKELLNSNIIL